MKKAGVLLFVFMLIGAGVFAQQKKTTAKPPVKKQQAAPVKKAPAKTQEKTPAKTQPANTKTTIPEKSKTAKKAPANQRQKAVLPYYQIQNFISFNGGFSYFKIPPP